MEYKKIVKGRFIERPNRFVALVDIKGEGEVKVHVKNTGRCRELLVPGATVYLEDFIDRLGSRKMRYSLVGVEKRLEQSENDTYKRQDIGDGNSQARILMVNMDSQAPNKVVQEALEEWKALPNLKGEITMIKPEQKYGNSRFDFYVETAQERAYIEVKGVTLEHGGLALFPDAPTKRGVKHIHELIEAAGKGYKAYILFVIQMKGMKSFSPNDETDPEFGKALRMARDAGVNVLAYDCIVTDRELLLDEQVPIEL